MNSLLTDIRRGILSIRFLLGLVTEILILRFAGADSEIYRAAVPVLASFPLSADTLQDLKTGFLKAYLPRSGYASYIAGRYLAGAALGGLLPVLGTVLYGAFFGTADQDQLPDTLLILISGMLWAGVAMLLTVMADSSYVAYGGSFVLFYIMAILKKRYWNSLYLLDPEEWLFPANEWLFDSVGIAVMLGLITVDIGIIFYIVMRRRLWQGV